MRTNGSMQNERVTGLKRAGTPMEVFDWSRHSNGMFETERATGLIHEQTPMEFRESG
jgi:hypothetical protein